MKSLELGIVPVPTIIDDFQIHQTALAQQAANRQQILDDEDDDEVFDEDEEEEDSEFEEDEKEVSTSKQKRDYEDEPSKGESTCKAAVKMNTGDQFEDASPAIDVTVATPVDAPTAAAPPRNSNQPESQEIDQEAEAARCLLYLSESWMVQPPTETEKEEGPSVLQETPLVVAAAPVPPPAQPPVGVPHVSWSLDEDHRPRSRPRSYSVNVPPSHDPHSKVINYAMPTVNEDISREGTSRRYSLSALSESRRFLNSPVPSSMYSRASALSEKYLNPKENVSYNKQWQESGGEQPMDLRVVKAPQLMLYSPQQPPVWNNSGVNETTTRATVIESPVYSMQYSESLQATTDYVAALSLNKFSPSTGERMSRKKELNDDMPETVVNPQAPEYSALSPIYPASVDGDNQPYVPPAEDDSNVSTVESNSEATSGASHTRLKSSELDEGERVCRICNKTFSEPSELRLHVNIHYFERPFRCDSCAVSFCRKGHLLKHKGSAIHYNKVKMNMTFGTATTENPRPFRCADCKIAFRIHGLLAKHLRTKMHIMKLERLEKLPLGMYAEMERSGINLNEISTADCESALESLQVMAKRLYLQNPCRMRWLPDQQRSTSGKDERVVSSPSTQAPSYGSSDEAIPSTSWQTGSTRFPHANPPPGRLNHGTTETNPKAPLKVQEVRLEASEEETLRPVQRAQDDYGPPPTNITATDLSQMANVEKELYIPALHRSSTCHLCGRICKSVNVLQVHLHYEHQGGSGPSGTSADMIPAIVEEVPSQQQQLWVAPLDGNQSFLVEVQWLTTSLVRSGADSLLLKKFFNSI